LKKLIAGEDLFSVEGNIRMPGGASAASDEKILSTHDVHLIQRFDFECVRIDEARGAAEKFNVIAAELIFHDTDFAFGDLSDADGEISNGNAIANDVITSVKRTMAKSGEMKNRFAQSFAGNGAAMDADAAEHIEAIDDSDTLAEFCGGNGAFLSGGAAADYDEVKGLEIHELLSSVRKI
jgi:hypothetical protein